MWPYAFTSMYEYSLRDSKFWSKDPSAKYRPTQSQKLKNKKKNSRRKK